MEAQGVDDAEDCGAGGDLHYELVVYIAEGVDIGEISAGDNVKCCWSEVASGADEDLSDETTHQPRDASVVVLGGEVLGTEEGVGDDAWGGGFGF